MTLPDHAHEQSNSVIEYDQQQLKYRKDFAEEVRAFYPDKDSYLAANFEFSQAGISDSVGVSPEDAYDLPVAAYDEQA